ncbi:MAG: thiamine phosphate synthase [Muribaculum sp.]|nr:thiamine phosphate synthase [Muribaculum sp.]
MLQYITDNKSTIPVEDQVKKVLEAGCGWIEIDTRGIDDNRIKEIVGAIMPMCLEKEAFLLMRDKVELAKEVNVGGVVISLGSGEFPSHARAHLGAAAVIGVEVHTEDQISTLKGLDVDYVMMTPYKASETDEIQSLGVDGIRKLCDFMKSEQFELPRVAAGEAMAEDVKPLMDAGCNGVATSDLTAFAK